MGLSTQELNMTELGNSRAYESLKLAARSFFLSLGCAVMITTVIMAKLVRFLSKGMDPVTVIFVIGISSFLGLMSEKILHASVSIFAAIVFSLFLSERIAALPVTLGIISGEKGLIFEIYTFSWLIVNYGILLLIFMPVGCIFGYLLRELFI